MNSPYSPTSYGLLTQEDFDYTFDTGGMFNYDGARILCIADLRGELSRINRLAQETGAQYVLHTGDFGFYERSSLHRLSNKTLKAILQHTTVIPREDGIRLSNLSSDELRQIVNESPDVLSEFPDFLSGVKRLDVPVYTTWGACDDLWVVELLRKNRYHIPNLHILDQSHTVVLKAGALDLRLFGIGGALIQEKFFDHRATGPTGLVGGEEGVAWMTALKMGELVETAKEVYSDAETRMLLVHTNPAQEPLISQLASVLKVDFTISGGLHLRYAISYNEYALHSMKEHYYNRMLDSREAYIREWNSMFSQNQQFHSQVLNERDNVYLHNTLSVITHVAPSSINDRRCLKHTLDMETPDDQSFEGLWHFNLVDAAYGYLLFRINQKRISTEIVSAGMSYGSCQETIPDIPRVVTESQTTSTEDCVWDGYLQVKRRHQKELNADHGCVGVEEEYAELASQPVQEQTATEESSDSDTWRGYIAAKMESQLAEMALHDNRGDNGSKENLSENAVCIRGIAGSDIDEEDVKDFFGHDAVLGIRFAWDLATDEPVCYVEMANKSCYSMALSKRSERIKNTHVTITAIHNNLIFEL